MKSHFCNYKRNNRRGHLCSTGWRETFWRFTELHKLMSKQANKEWQDYREWCEVEDLLDLEGPLSKGQVWVHFKRHLHFNDPFEFVFSFPAVEMWSNQQNGNRLKQIEDPLRGLDIGKEIISGSMRTYFVRVFGKQYIHRTNN